MWKEKTTYSDYRNTGLFFPFFPFHFHTNTGLENHPSYNRGVKSHWCLNYKASDLNSMEHWHVEFIANKPVFSYIELQKRSLKSMIRNTHKHKQVKCTMKHELCPFSSEYAWRDRWLIIRFSTKQSTMWSHQPHSHSNYKIKFQEKVTAAGESWLYPGLKVKYLWHKRSS